MTEWFPSREWLAAYRDRLNENETYRTASEGWGEGFDGDFVFAVTDLPVAETTIVELPDRLTDDVRAALRSLPDDEAEALVEEAPPELETRMRDWEGTPRERLVAALLSTPVERAPDVTWSRLLGHVPDEFANLLDQLERYVVDDAVYAYLDLHDGTCRDAEVLERPTDREPGFVLRGPYGTWVDIIEGAQVLDTVFSREMDLDGSVTTIMGYGEAAQAMGDTANVVSTAVLFESDEAV